MNDKILNNKMTLLYAHNPKFYLSFQPGVINTEYFTQLTTEEDVKLNMLNAATENLRDVIDLLLEKNSSISVLCMGLVGASITANIKLVDFFIDKLKKTNESVDEYLNRALYYTVFRWDGSTEHRLFLMIKYLFDLGADSLRSCQLACVQIGNVEGFKYFENMPGSNKFTVNDALIIGPNRLEMLKYLIEVKNGDALDEALEMAIKCQRKDCVEYLLSKGAKKYELILNGYTGSETCSICKTDSTDNLGTTECNHVFHPECINLWLQESTTCPVCRTSLYIKK